MKLHLLPLPLFIAVHLLAEQPDTVASQSIVVSYKVNSPTRPPTAPAEMFSKQFYHCQEYFLYIFISSWLFHFCAFSKEGIALHYSFLTMHVALLAGGTQVQSCMQYHRAFM